MAIEEGVVSRKVYFFRVEHFDQFKDFLPLAFTEVSGLPFHDQGRYMQDATENVRLSVYPDQLTYPLRLRFGKTRKDLLPDVERGGNLQTLELDEDAGLIDVCHIVFFSDGHVAAEFNHDGPRINKLGEYLFMKGKNLPSVPRFLPLFERDIVGVLSELENIRVLEIDVPPDTASLIREADLNLAAAIEASEKAGSTKKVGITLSAESAAGYKLRDIGRKLASLIKLYPHERTRFNTLKATGFIQGSNIRRYVDLLEEKLISGELFVRNTPRSRSINSVKAYELIEAAYHVKYIKLADAAVANNTW